MRFIVSCLGGLQALGLNFGRVYAGVRRKVVRAHPVSNLVSGGLRSMVRRRSVCALVCERMRACVHPGA